MPTPADIERLSAWLAATDISSLELREPSGTLRLERCGEAVSIDTTCANTPETSMHPAETIRAETPGIFLHGHPMATCSLVEVGVEVVQGQMIGLLRVGVVLLPVRASQAGRIEGYWAEDGAAVEYGTPLIELQLCEAAS